MSTSTGVHGSPMSETVTLPGSGKATPTPSRPSTPSNDPPSSQLPLRAGFDLGAIKNVLHEVEQDPSKVKVTPPTATPAAPKTFLSRLAPPPIAPPSNRSQSTPPQVVEANGHMRSTSLDYGYVNAPVQSDDRGPKTAGLSPSESAMPSFSRSFSATSSREENNSYPSTSSMFGSTSFATPDEEYSTFSSQQSTRFNSNPLSLPDDVVPAWGASSSSLNLSSSFTPTTAKPFKSSFSSIPSPPTMPNPFSSPFMTPDHDRTPVLSFGAPDGTLSASAGSQSESWDTPPIGTRKKTMDGFNANPWS